MLRIGIAGGMGPAASTALLQQITEAGVRHGAQRDQDHPEVILIAATQLPDRPTHLLDNGPDYVPGLRRVLRRLKQAGADIAIIGCNTAHAKWTTITKDTPIECVSIIDVTCAHIAEHHADKRVMVIGSRVIDTLNLYRTPLTEQACSVAQTPAEIQKIVHGAIYAFKQGQIALARRTMQRVAHRIIEGNLANVVVLGCTELPLMMNDMVRTDTTTTHTASILAPSGRPNRSVEVVDPNRLIADHVVARAMAHTKNPDSC